MCGAVMDTKIPRSEGGSADAQIISRAWYDEMEVLAP